MKLTNYELAKYWELVYALKEDVTEDDTEVTYAGIKYGYTTTGQVEVHHEELAIYLSDDEIVIAIGGSSGDREELYNGYRANLDAYPTIGGVHNGYMKSAQHILGFINEYIVDYKGRDITFVGYSRGGAIAQVVANLYGKHGTMVVTFGSPRPYTLIANAGESYIHHRVYFNSDPVKSIPFAILPPFWCHDEDYKYRLAEPNGKGSSHTKYDEYFDLYKEEDFYELPYGSLELPVLFL